MGDSVVNNSIIVISVIAYLSAVVGAVVAFHQFRASAQTNTATFWLNLRSMFGDYEGIHRSLQIDATWRDPERPVSNEEAVTIVAYMGMFELVYKMLKRKLVDWETFRDIFGYRVLLIMSSPAIVRATLVDNGRWWLTFRELAKDLGHDVPDRADSALDRDGVKLAFPVGWGRSTGEPVPGPREPS